MTTTRKFRGTIVPMVTPFTPSGQLDDAAVERITAHISGQRLGIFVLGTTGEAASIPGSERRRLVEIVATVTRGRVPVFAGIGDNCVGDSVSAAHDYLKVGADAVVAHLPSYYTLTPAEMRAYFETLADGIHGSLILYNIPQTTHMSLPIDVVQALADRPTIVGFKDSENTAGRLEQVVTRLGGREAFSIFMGTSFLSVAALRCGFDGLVPSSGNLVPHLWRALEDAATAGRWTEAEALQARLDLVARAFQRGRTLGQSLGALKAAMSARGLCGPTLHPPLLTLDESTCSAIVAEVAALGETPPG
ncbi:MAG: dihydrodipicolinate synthase family protein [Opitutaceae bacterium]|nr:dihydrodipicolinate synthase family protein [Opitutaceae bacterium]